MKTDSEMLLAPIQNKYSGLLKKSAQSNIAFMNDLKYKLALKRKVPHKH